MATIQQREKRRANRMKRQRKDQIELEDQLIEKEGDLEEEVDLVEKDYGEYPTAMVPMHGPTSYEELDAAEKAREQAEQVREETYTVQELVYNIAYSMMSPEEKGKAIAKVGKDFGARLKTVTSGPMEMEKQFDMDLLEAQSILAKDYRHLGMGEKVLDWISKAKLTAATEAKLSDSDFALVVERDGKKIRKYPIHDKAHVRNALARAAQMMAEGGEAATDAKAAMPKIKAAAKKMGIGMDKSIMIEKDVSGNWRAVLWPTNNFKDRDGEIISEAAHREYVDWVTKNMDCAPVFATWHTPGTARENPMDFIGYEDGFMLTSLPLTEVEAGRLLKMQTQTDIGLSIGGIALERDKDESYVITKYRMFEISDLPLERAANMVTGIELISKEAQMNIEQYLSEMLGDEKRAKDIIGKMALTQKQLREAGVQEKEVKTPETPDAVTPAKDAPAINLDEIVDRISKEFGMEELSNEFLVLKEAAEKVPVLEELVKELLKSKDDALAEMIQPPAGKGFAWLKEKRPTAKKDNVLDPEKDEDEKLQKSAPEIGWLSEATQTQPVVTQ